MKDKAPSKVSDQSQTKTQSKTKAEPQPEKPTELPTADNMILSFGKYKGESVRKIAKHNPSYLYHLCENNRDSDFAHTYTLRVIKEALVRHSRMPFGRYVGKRMLRLEEYVPDYLRWLKQKLEEVDEEEDWLLHVIRYFKGELSLENMGVDPDEIPDDEDDSE